MDSINGMVGIEIWNWAQKYCPLDSVKGIYSIDDLKGKTLQSGCAMVINTGSKYSRHKNISFLITISA
jgi:hypothetical protein